jgi:hypothetical protein
MTPTGDEATLLKRIDDALRDAVKAKNLNWSKSTRIKRQKYANMAVDHFSSDAEEAPAPITRSWFKYGYTQPLSPAGTTRLDIEQPDSPSIGNRSAPTQEVRSPYDDPIYDTNVADFMQFFLEGATGPSLTEETWYLSDLDFLEIYYKNHAPPELADIYLSNIHLRKAIVGAQESVKDIYDNRAQLFGEGSDSLPNFSDTGYYRMSSEAAIQLRLEMRDHPTLFNESIDLIQSFTDLVQDVLLRLESIPRRDIIRPHSRLLQELEDFYDSIVWLVPASEMSAKTAEGPHADVLKSAAQESIRNANETFQEEFPKIREECESADLLPRPSDYPDYDDEVSSIVDEMTEIIDRPTIDE